MESKKLAGKYIEMYSEEDVDFVVDMFDLDVDEIKMQNLKKYVGNGYAYVHFFENENGYLDFAYGSEFSRDSLNGSEEIKVDLPSKKSDDAVEVLDLTKPIAEQLAGKKVRIESVEHLDYVINAGSLTDSVGARPYIVKSIESDRTVTICFEECFAENSTMWHWCDYLGEITSLSEEIKIPLPSVESRILAEKVSDGSVVIDVELYRPESMDAKMKEALEYADGSNDEVSATSILSAAKAHLDERARIYDRPQGERSIRSVVEAFNALTGDGLMNTEERGWMFMVLLKLSRSQQGTFKLDNYEDGTNYFALMGESAANAHNEAMARETTMPDMIK